MNRIKDWDEWAKGHHVKVNYQPKNKEQIRQQNEKAQNGKNRNSQKNYSYKV